MIFYPEIGEQAIDSITKKQGRREIYLPCLFIFIDVPIDYLYLSSSDTVRRFLPLALLLASTFRPLAVDILSIKPCLFLLFLFDG